MSQPGRKLNRDALRSLIEGGVVGFRQNPTSYILRCPKCGKPKLHIRKVDGRSKCFRCGPDLNGWADYALSLVTGQPAAELAELLYGYVVPKGMAGFIEDDEPLVNPFDLVMSDEEDADTVVIGQDDLPPMMCEPFDVVPLDSRHGAPGLSYLESRGIDLALAQKYGVKFQTSQRRVIFPVVVEGVLRGWQARLIVPSEGYNEDGEHWSIPKILTTGKVTGKVLMFEDRLKQSPHGVMVEGPIDAIKCDLVGGNAATMGKGEAANLVKRFLRAGVQRLYVGLDDDADDDVARVVSAAEQTVEVYRLVPPRGREDLGDCTPEEVLEQFHRAERIHSGQVFVYLDSPY